MTPAELAAAERRIHVCDVLIVTRDGLCGDLPAFPYEARCEAGHVLTGYACEPCMAARHLGCGVCLAQGCSRVPAMTFEPGSCHCGCGMETRLAHRSDARYGRVRGRPQRYVSQHNPRPLQVGANGRE